MTLKFTQLWNAFLPGFRRSFLVFCIFWNLSPAFGKDLQVLIRILYAAFAAEQMSAICTNAGISLSDEDREIFKSATIYSSKIKEHVVAGLLDSDNYFVVKSAADRAKLVTQADINALAAFTSEQLPAATLQWCENKVAPFAAQVIGVYFRQPYVIEQLIARAKAD